MHSSIPLEVIPIKQHDLRARGLYWRATDPLSSTEFSFTRFLTPYLAEFQGWAVFVDCDFLFRKDIAGLLEYRDPKKALYCVQHDYRPKETIKMDGQIQTHYPRKNWSSFMLINCAHEEVRALTPAVVNTGSGLYLHRFNWLTDDAIGALPVSWNYLEGWNSKTDCGDPIAVHFTRGGPWFEHYQNVEFGDEWQRYDLQTLTQNNMCTALTQQSGLPQASAPNSELSLNMPSSSLNTKAIPFNRPHLTGRELSYITEAYQNGKLAGDGAFTHRCQTWLERQSNNAKALLTHSCTAALEMAAILCQIGPGDEVILPSYTFVSTANAFVTRGAKPVFVDIRPDTLNIDERLIEAAITPRTRAIVPVHYAGVSCEMDRIMEIAKTHGLYVIEDAAQGCLSKYKGQPLGTIGHLGCYSFHETKNITSGEGGALIINDPALVSRAEIIREKGTDRSKFLRGEIDKYTWVDIGSSYLPGELSAAFLWGQMEFAEEITRARLEVWSRYDDAFRRCRLVQTPHVPGHCTHNGHLYYLINRSLRSRDSIIADMREMGVIAPFHYVPLHSSPFGKTLGSSFINLPTTNRVAAELIRLPLYVDLTKAEQEKVIDAALVALGAGRSKVRRKIAHSALNAEQTTLPPAYKKLQHSRPKGATLI